MIHVVGGCRNIIPVKFCPEHRSCFCTQIVLPFMKILENMYEQSSEKEDYQSRISCFSGVRFYSVFTVTVEANDNDYVFKLTLGQ